MVDFRRSIFRIEVSMDQKFEVNIELRLETIESGKP